MAWSKSGIRRLILFLAVTVTTIAIDLMWLKSIQPRVSTQDKAANEEALRHYEIQEQFANTLALVIVLGTAWILIPRPRIRRPSDSFIK